ncbi:LytR/AlgR family response regulator transcription factor [Aliikangiella coralliicola]|uniref:Response regulator transcription factor n=1 Tax=Aliikangiella coralliicola TaxID=2592383 RepID=A0A545U8X0_9GAMM|nr:LytTR family DNA-binding domain-containing protein [Aliikangiella coralliicola]TQV85920.1 response regulator transcription factor [Aliikangiella coralliicola]
MRIIVVEDEPLVAQRIVRLSKQILRSDLVSISIQSTLEGAINYLQEHCIDLLLLDLNLNGKDGFEVLKQAVAQAFHTVIISANTDKAVAAFEFGVLDFVSKPVTVKRLQTAFERYHSSETGAARSTKYLSIRKPQGLTLIDVEDIRYIQGSGIYAEIHLQKGESELHDKSLNVLESILPASFIRIHRSFIVNLRDASHFRSHGGSKYDLVLHNAETLPVSRTRYKYIKHRLP